MRLLYPILCALALTNARFHPVRRDDTSNNTQLQNSSAPGQNWTIFGRPAYLTLIFFTSARSFDSDTGLATLGTKAVVTIKGNGKTPDIDMYSAVNADEKPVLRIRQRYEDWKIQRANIAGMTKVPISLPQSDSGEFNAFQDVIELSPDAPEEEKQKVIRAFADDSNLKNVAVGDGNNLGSRLMSMNFDKATQQGKEVAQVLEMSGRQGLENGGKAARYLGVESVLDQKDATGKVTTQEVSGVKKLWEPELFTIRSLPQEPEILYLGDQESNSLKFSNNLELNPKDSTILSTFGSSEADSAFTTYGDSHSGGSNPKTSDLVRAIETKSMTGLARINGFLNTISVLERVSIPASAAILAAGAAFIVIDFINGDYVGGALAVAGTAAGLGIGLATEALALSAGMALGELGPIGWIVGGLVALMFTAIPGGVNPRINYPAPQDPKEILQYSFFNDFKITGNEKCRTDTKDVKANPNCTAVYGPNIVAKILNLNLYDVVALFLHANNGYGMTIEELSNFFYVLTPRVTGDGSDQVATIDCGNRMPQHDNYGGPDDPDTDLCRKPTYRVNQTLITIPVMNQTADVVYKRLFPAPNADCQVVTYPGGQFYNVYNVTVLGLPAGIACGIQPGFNVSGALVNLNGTAPANGSIVSPGQNSTSGTAGAYVAPPPKSPFQNITQYCACLTDTKKKTLCLPPGQYASNLGPQGPIVANIYQLTLMPGAKLNIAYNYKSFAPGGTTNFTRDYTTNLTINDPVWHPEQLYKDLQNIFFNKYNTAYPINVIAPSAVDGFCLFSETHYAGDIYCAGLGGDELPANWKNKAKSLRVYNGTNIEIFGTGYGQGGSEMIAQDEPDLSAYSLQGTDFSKQFSAVWAYKSKIAH